MQTIRVSPDVAITFFEQSAVLLDSRKNAYYALNDSAAEFCKYLTQMGSFEDALQQMLELYQDSADVIRKDMEELVDSLVKVGLLQRVQIVP